MKTKKQHNLSVQLNNENPFPCQPGTGNIKHAIGLKNTEDLIFVTNCFENRPEIELLADIKKWAKENDFILMYVLGVFNDIQNGDKDFNPELLQAYELFKDRISLLNQ